MDETEAVKYLHSLGYAVQKKKQYDRDILYLVRRTSTSGKILFSTRRMAERQPGSLDNLGVLIEESAKITLSDLEWKTLKNTSDITQALMDGE